MTETTSSRAVSIDGPAIVLSSLCLVHCLLLPIMSATLPLAGALGEAEWVHQLFVAVALPFALMALTSKHITPLTGGLIAVGFGALVAGAFVEALHDYETLLTVVGACALAAGHAGRWMSARRQS